MKILLTGHNGYIGSSMCNFLIKSGYDVTGLDRGNFPTNGFHAYRLPVKEIISDFDEIQEDKLASFDAIIHLAAISDDKSGNNSDELIMDNNLRKTKDFALKSREAGVSRFVFSSSCGIHVLKNDEKITEDSPVDLKSPYTRSKYHAEREVLKLKNATFCPIVLRNASVYGFAPNLRVDLVINNFILQALITGMITMNSDGQSYRSFIHIDDLSKAYELILLAPLKKVKGEKFIIAEKNSNYRILELAELVMKEVGISAKKIVRTDYKDPRSFNVSPQKLYRSFPEMDLKWTVKEGIRKEVEYLSSEKSLFNTIQNITPSVLIKN